MRKELNSIVHNNSILNCYSEDLYKLSNKISKTFVVEIIGVHIEVIDQINGRGCDKTLIVFRTHMCMQKIYQVLQGQFFDLW